MFRLIRFIDAMRPKTGFITVWKGLEASELRKVLGENHNNLHLQSYRLQIRNSQGWVNFRDAEEELNQESQQVADAISETLKDFFIFVY